MQEVENKDEEVRVRGPLICFHQYGEDEDLKTLFETIKEFKKDKKIKYTHFSQKRVIYFNVPSADVSDFSKIIRFSRSKSTFKSSYNCGNDKEEFEKLNNQMDSFIKIKGITNEDGTYEVVFRSNLPQGLHIRASKRIFEAADVEFNRDKSISTSKPYRYDDDNADDTPNQTKKSFKKQQTHKSVVADDEESHEQEEHERHEQEEQEVHDDHISQNNEDEVEVKAEVKVEIVKEPKKRGRKPGAQIVRKA